MVVIFPFAEYCSWKVASFLRSHTIFIGFPVIISRPVTGEVKTKSCNIAVQGRTGETWQRMAVAGEFVHHFLIVVHGRQSPATWTSLLCIRNPIIYLMRFHIILRPIPMRLRILHLVLVVLANPDVIKYLHYRVVVFFPLVVSARSLQSLQVFLFCLAGLGLHTFVWSGLDGCAAQIEFRHTAKVEVIIFFDAHAGAAPRYAGRLVAVVAQEEAHVVAGLVDDDGIDHGDALSAVDLRDILVADLCYPVAVAINILDKGVVPFVFEGGDIELKYGSAVVIGEIRVLAPLKPSSALVASRSTSS